MNYRQPGSMVFAALVALSALVAAGCSNSPLQPTISDKDAPTVLQPATVTPLGAAPAASGSSASVSCTLAKGHSVYYAGSAIRLSYVCTEAIGKVTTTSMPSYLTGNGSGTSLVFTGTAPATASSTTWAYAINGEPTTGDTTVTTKVITGTPAVTLKSGTPDLTTNYGTEIDLGFAAVTLDSTWDGSTDDVTLSVLPGTSSGADTPTAFNGQAFVSADSDIPGLSYADSCATGSGAFVCPATTVAAGADSVTGGSDLHFAYSPFDQGTYALSVRPYLTIEGAVMRLPVLKQTITVPEATYGNVTLTHTGTTGGSAGSLGTLDGAEYTYGFDLSPNSTPLAPILGVTYGAQSGGAVNKTFFNRVTMDRTASSAAATPTGVTQSSDQVVATGLAGMTDSGFFRVRALTDGSWATFGGETDGSGNQNVYFNHITDDGTTQAVALNTIVTALASPNTLISVDASAEFVDPEDGKSRIGFAYLWNDGTPSYWFDVGKINPAGAAGTGAGTVEDDAAWKPLDVIDFPLPFFELGFGATSIDNLAMRVDTYNGASAFYFGLRDGQEVKVGRLLTAISGSNYTKSFVFLTDDIVPTHVFSLTPPNGGDHQTLKIALGKIGGSEQVLGVVYRETDNNVAGGGPFCWFRRIDTTMNTSTRSTPLKLSSGPCSLPQIEYNQTTGRFVTVFAEQVSGKYQIVEREITLTQNDTDSASTEMVVTSGLATAPARLEATFYPAGNWLGVIYRETATDAPKVHGFHVSPY